MQTQFTITAQYRPTGDWMPCKVIDLNGYDKYAVVRISDGNDVVAICSTLDRAYETAADLDSGKTEAPNRRADRLATLRDVRTQDLVDVLVINEQAPMRHWRVVVDTAAALREQKRGGRAEDTRRWVDLAPALSVLEHVAYDAMHPARTVNTTYVVEEGEYRRVSQRNAYGHELDRDRALGLARKNARTVTV